MLVDYVKKDGWFYRNSYPFSYRPSQVRVCAMVWWRLPVFGLARLLMSLVIWFIFGGIFGIFAWTTGGLCKFLVGKKYVYGGQTMFEGGPFPGLIGAKLLDRLVLLNYREASIESLPVIAGRKILPWHVVAAIGIPWALWYVVPSAVSGSVSVAHGIWGAVTWAATEFMSLSLWIPIALVAGFVILLLVAHGIRQFRKSEMYGLLKMSIRAGIDHICPIVPVK